MGGRGSGGRRTGAGRKPKDARLLAIQGGLSRRPGATAVDPSVSAPVIHAAVPPPDDLQPDELLVWERDAPLATAQGTLTSAMAGAFRAYCELEAMTTRMRQSINKALTIVVESEAGVIERPNPLLTHYRGNVQRLQSMRKDFRLSPFGKEEVAAATQTATPGSRLSAFAARRA